MRVLYGVETMDCWSDDFFLVCVFETEKSAQDYIEYMTKEMKEYNKEEWGDLYEPDIHDSHFYIKKIESYKDLEDYIVSLEK